ncbi:F-box/LRR-repeat protein At4g14103-like [Impatiens glandulifera]|uniref:F-box/LRR-repeat protein At4g14103-like n=1 Tax=Impatiens glandulifera TaxID=253017 RepID=UPI001FB0EDC5|nr:F-box/LRR-repeat protein At4g14103-like [Impatiens glandulifera]
MNSIFKFQNTCNEDRISSLPDSVLSQILSLLPTKFVVATSVLSHRWKNLWRSVTNLDFADSLFFEPSFEYLNPNHKLGFMDYTDNVMINRDNSLNIDKFYVSCSGDCDVNRVNKWVNLAIKQNVMEMILEINLSETFNLPIETFACETLAILKLNHRILVDIVPSFVYLPSLKILHFHGVEFMQYEYVEMMVKGCPLLEELILNRCKWIHGCVLRIVGLSFLKKLTIDWYGMTVSDRENEVVVDVPSLEYLDLKDYTSENFTMLNLGSIVDANIDVSQKIDRFVSFSEYGNRIFALLWAIATVRSLSLSRDTMAVSFRLNLALSYAYKNIFPTFANLTRLDLCVDGWSGWSVLPGLLASSPILETLIFSEGLVQNFHFHLGVFRFNWSPPENVPSCLLFHLKEIEIKDFRGLPDELILIKYLLKNALVLEKMLIECHLLEDDDNITEKLQKFGKGSDSCHIVLVF